MGQKTLPAKTLIATLFMATANFRFYAHLNYFLAPGRRGHAFACACAAGASTKHMIEALGVPHTEVGLVLVNGEAAGFDRLLQEGDRVAAYPKFEAFDVSTLACLRERPAPDAGFVADAHLGGLARLLRMAGFDTLYGNDLGDGEIEAIAAAQGRVVLTRDRELLKRRGVEHGCYIRALKPACQLREIADRLDLAPRARPFTLCLDCNAPLRSVDKALVWRRLPASVGARHEQFRMCGVCQRIFWKGSHWQRMCALLGALRIGPS
jgi:uncharacterized protein with PIN domain